MARPDHDDYVADFFLRLSMLLYKAFIDVDDDDDDVMNAEEEGMMLKCTGRQPAISN